MVIVDKLSKRVLFIPTNENVEAKYVARIFETFLFSKFGVPDKISPNRDPKFTAEYWKSLMEIKGVQLNMAKTAHLETDGQSERSIQTSIGMLRPTFQSEPKIRDEYLPKVEFEFNASKQESTNLAPFEIDIGRIPSRPLTKITY